MKKISFGPVGSSILFFLLSSARAAQTDIPGPAGSGEFGTAITVLPNGNFVVTDPFFDLSGPTVADVGAVYLYSPVGVLLGTLKGSTANDQVGSGGVIVLSNGNFVVRSLSWHNGAAADAGAVTWGNGTTGFPGGPVVTVSPVNSLVGAAASDQVGGGGVTTLINGNYVVVSPNWDNGAVANAGAATWGNGSTGITGPVTPANSLVGSAAGDLVGNFGAAALTNGNYVVLSRSWRNGAATNAGAATWGNGSTGIVGAVSPANSLVGGTTANQVGNSVTALTNGNYVVLSSLWDNGAASNVGAATWGNGSTGISGVVSPANSLVGSSPGDSVGQDVTALTNGNYVVQSSFWDNGAASNAGAATWGNGNSGAVGVVSSANSLIGSSVEDRVGSFGVNSPGIVALTNGNYVVLSSAWDDNVAGVLDAGAATWGNGSAGIVGVVSPANSLVGATASDNVGSKGLVALTNGNFVVLSPEWDKPAAVVVANAGAATWGNGSTGIVGVVSPANSLIGSSASDRVGDFGATALTNGNYVVRSGSWRNGANSFAGAATWGNGSTGIVGTVSPANSLVGGSALDQAGSGGVIALTNGNYVVLSPGWDNGFQDVGAATFGNGSTGVVGAISPANSLVGGSSFDRVGTFGAIALTSGNYVVSSPGWRNGAIARAGAVTWANGGTGLVGSVSPANSLVGVAIDDFVGLNQSTSGVTALPGGNYAVSSSSWNNGALLDSGAVSLGNGNAGTSRVINSANSVLGSVASAGGNLTFAYDAPREQLIVGRSDSSIVTLFSNAGSVAFSSSLFTASEASGSASVTITRSGGSFGPGSVTFLTTPGTATAGAGGDYLPVASQVVDFAAGEFARTVSVAVLPGNAANEVNETFGVALTSPVGLTLGAQTTAKVRIVDAGDAAAPSAPGISVPLAGALVGVNPGAATTVSGSASDNKGIALVEVRVNGGAFVPAALTSVNGATANYSLAITPVTGSNTIHVRSTDTSGLVSPIATRSFIATRPLVVATSGAGSVTGGFVPSSFRQVGKSLTLTATVASSPAPGTIFTGWTLSGPNLAQVGLLPGALEKNTLTFIFREGTQWVAGFVPNPFSSPVAGNYKGVIQASSTLPDRAPLGVGAEDGTNRSNGTEGLFYVVLTGTGGFSGSITIDGLVLNIAGAFDANGIARFGTARALSLKVPRPNKPSLVLECRLEGAPSFSTQRITGTVSALDNRNLVTAVSEIRAERAFFNGVTQIVPAQLLGPGNTNGVFNVVFAARPPADQPPGFETTFYPQGDGFGTLTVTKAGVVTLTNCTLADGTTGITASSTLSQGLISNLFIPLYNKQGFIETRLLMSLSSADTDMTASDGDVFWSRPAQNTHHYPAGWPEVIKVVFKAAKYTATAGLSVVKAPDGPDGDDLGDNLGPPDDFDGNVTLQFSDGQLPGLLIKQANASTADVVTKVPDNDPTFSLSITRSNGLFSGSFIHGDDTVPGFKGIIYQKGPNAGGYGFFLTTQPSPIDYTGESGGVSLIGQP